MDSLFILGAGGFTRNILWLIDAINQTSQGRDSIALRGFVAPSGNPKDILGFPVLGADEWAIANLDRSEKYVIAVGASSTRQKLAHLYEENGFEAITLIDPRAAYGKGRALGTGTVILACASISLGTRIGRHVILNHNCTVGHDVVIEDFVTVSPGANISGNAHIGSGALIGTGAIVLPGVSIGAGAILGAGSVATKDLEGNATYIGIPARRI